jgi:hypothetical protein
MSTFFEVVLSCVERGWHIFPCKPSSKTPLTAHGHLDASKDEVQVRVWWAKIKRDSSDTVRVDSDFADCYLRLMAVRAFATARLVEMLREYEGRTVGSG